MNNPLKSPKFIAYVLCMAIYVIIFTVYLGKFHPSSIQVQSPNLYPFLNSSAFITHNNVGNTMINSTTNVTYLYILGSGFSPNTTTYLTLYTGLGLGFLPQANLRSGYHTWNLTTSRFGKFLFLGTPGYFENLFNATNASQIRLYMGATYLYHNQSWIAQNSIILNIT